MEKKSNYLLSDIKKILKNKKLNLILTNHMKKILACIILLSTLLLISTTNLFANTCNLKLSDNNRFLVHMDGTPFFPTADTGWYVPWKLTRSEAETYFQTRKDQKFNMVGIITFDDGNTTANRYGDQPFVIVGGKYDPTQPVTTPGNDPNNSTEYDYWDNLEYIIDLAASKGIYIVILPAWGQTCVVSSDRIFNESSAYTYGQWIGNRFSGKTNIIWMMGGDCIPTGYENVFRAMAEGVADGVNGVNNKDGNADYSTTLMSYHPPKWSHSSSYWFPNDAFMDFNSTQDQPSDQITRMQSDWGLSPAKPTWLFEGGYEGRHGTYGAWQCRFQAYQTVFSGGFGHMYGDMGIFEFNSGWEANMTHPGALDMQHFVSLMSSLTLTQFINRIPYQALIDGDTGSMTGSEGIYSTCIVATRTIDGDKAFIYSANGRNIRVKMNLIAGPTANAYWFDPRSGTLSGAGTAIQSGPGAPIVEFDPPGSTANGNDYVLILDSPNGKLVFKPYTDNIYNRGLLHCDSIVTNLWADGADNCFLTPDDNSSGRAAVAPILNASNNWGIARDDSTIPAFMTNSPYGGDYLVFSGGQSILITNAWLGGDALTLDMSFRYNGLPPSSGDNYAGLFWTLPIKAYLRNDGDDTHAKLLMLVYDAAGNPHFFYSSKTLSPNIWYQLSFSASNDNLQVSVGNDIEGFVSDTATATGLLAPGDFTHVILGSDYWGPTRLFHGDMDEVRWGTAVPEPYYLSFIIYCLLFINVLRKSRN